MQVHSNSSTNPTIRLRIRLSTSSCRAIARQLEVAPSTVHRWKHRDSVRDKSSRPKGLRCAMSEECQILALSLRKKGMTLDECLDTLIAVFPRVSRATLHRFFVVSGVPRLKLRRTDRGGKYKDYKPGFVHIDHFNLPSLGAKKRYCFVAIDRNTRLAYLRIYDNKTAKSALDFLGRALEFFPFKVHRLLCDNGPEFTNRRYTQSRGGARVTHPLDALCSQRQILRRYTKPYTPATNGMAERFVGLCKHATVSKFRYQSHEHAEEAILQWLVFYNLYRPHGSLSRKTPIQQAMKGYKESPQDFNQDPDTHCRTFLTY